MLNIRSQQHIRFAKIEQAHAWVVVAVLVETVGNETVAISEPKVVKIIPKKLAQLSGFVARSVLLGAHAVVISHIDSPVISPFAKYFDFAIYNVATGLGAQPPTV
jgi:hypothetical protein